MPLCSYCTRTKTLEAKVSQIKSMIAVKTSATSSTTSKLTNEDRDTEEQSTRVLGTVCINRSSDKMGAPVTAM